MEWDEYFMGVARAVSLKSHCLSRQLGAIAVRDNRFIVATGYNGSPAGYHHCVGDICPRKKLGYESGQGLEVCPAAHAEFNVLIEAARVGVSLAGCTLYLSGPSPCRECSKGIVNAGIFEVVTDGDNYPQVGLSGFSILQECDIIVRKL